MPLGAGDGCEPALDDSTGGKREGTRWTDISFGPGGWPSEREIRFPEGSLAERLTPRETEILRLLAEGFPNRQIASLLRLRPSTVRSHVQSILSKLRVHSRLEAVAVAARRGFPGEAGVPANGPGIVLSTGAAARSAPPAAVVVVEPSKPVREAIRRRLDREPELRVVASVPRLRLARRTIGGAAVAIVHGVPWDEAVAEAALVHGSRSCRILVVAGGIDPERLLHGFEAGVRGVVEPAVSMDALAEAAVALARGELVLPHRAYVPLLRSLLEWRLSERTREELLGRLTRREREVLELLVEGRSNESIAEQLMISHDTARTHVQNILQKLGVHSRVAAASLARSNGLAMAEALR